VILTRLCPNCVQDELSDENESGDEECMIVRKRPRLCKPMLTVPALLPLPSASTDRTPLAAANPRCTPQSINPNRIPHVAADSVPERHPQSINTNRATGDLTQPHSALAATPHNRTDVARSMPPTTPMAPRSPAIPTPQTPSTSLLAPPSTPLVAAPSTSLLAPPSTPLVAAPTTVRPSMAPPTPSVHAPPPATIIALAPPPPPSALAQTPTAPTTTTTAASEPASSHVRPAPPSSGLGLAQICAPIPRSMASTGLTAGPGGLSSPKRMIPLSIAIGTPRVKSATADDLSTPQSAQRDPRTPYSPVSTVSTASRGSNGSPASPSQSASVVLDSSVALDLSESGDGKTTTGCAAASWSASNNGCWMLTQSPSWLASFRQPDGDPRRQRALASWPWALCGGSENGWTVVLRRADDNPRPVPVCSAQGGGRWFEEGTVDRPQKRYAPSPSKLLLSCQLHVVDHLSVQACEACGGGSRFGAAWIGHG
jgi:hypothetical protein